MPLIIGTVNMCDYEGGPRGPQDMRRERARHDLEQLSRVSEIIRDEDRMENLEQHVDDIRSKVKRLRRMGAKREGKRGKEARGLKRDNGR